MLIDLRHAGLAAEQEQRLRFVSHAIAAVRARVVYAPWDGTRCTALVANADDAYGVTAMRVALKRGTPVIALAQAGALQDAGASWLPSGASVQALMKAIEDALPRKGGAESARGETRAGDEPRAPTQEDASGIGLVRLARLPGDRELRASVGGRSYLVLRRDGRIKSRSRSDLLALEAKLGDAAWQFDALPERPKSHEFEIGASLDATLLNAAFRARERLPRFADGLHAMQEWPDLGQATHHVSALRVMRHLLRGAMSVDEVIAASAVAAPDINACLWAFAASGLLQSSAEGAGSLRDERNAAPPRRWKGMLNRLARHFGMTDA